MDTKTLAVPDEFRTTEIVTVPAASPMQLMEWLVKSGKDINPAALPGMMKELVTLQHMVEDRDARKEFAAAKARFKAKCPTIPKNRTAHIVSKDGGNKRDMPFADLQGIVAIVGPPLHSEGLDYSWDSEDAGGKLKTTCILKHVNGHSESSSWTTTTETNAAMSAQQKVAAAFSFGRRQTLVAILGLTTVDADNDAADDAAMRFVTQGQCETIQSTLAELGIDEAKFLAAFPGVEAVKKLRAIQYPTAMQMLEARKKSKGAKP